MEALSFTDVIDHVVLEELVDVVGGNFSKLHAIDSFKGCPRFKTMLFGKLLPLFFYNLFILRNRLEQLEYLVTSGLRQHIYSSNQFIY